MCFQSMCECTQKGGGRPWAAHLKLQNIWYEIGWMVLLSLMYYSFLMVY